MEKKLLSDESVEATLASIQKRREQLTAESKLFIPKTNMNLEIFGKRYNLHVSDKSELKFLCAFLDSLLTENVKRLGWTIEIGGWTVKDWIQDIMGKYAQLDTREELRKLDVAENRLVTMYTPEKKNQIEFNDILSDLNL